MRDKTLILGSFGHGYNDMYFYILPILISLFRIEFNLNYTQTGLIMTVFMANVAVFSSAWGSLVGKLGYNRLLSLGFLVASLGLLTVTLASSYTVLILLISLTAIGVSTFHPLTTAMVSFNTKKPGLSMGVFESSGAAGTVFAIIVISLLIGSWGWRWTTALLALPGFWLAYAFLNKMGINKQVNQPHKVGRPTTVKILVLFFAGRTVRGLAAGAVLAFLPTYILEAWSLRPSMGSLVYSTFFLGGLIGALFFGHLADRLSHIGLVTVSTLIPAFFMLLITQNIPLPLGILYIIILGICFLGFFPPHNRWIAEGIKQEQRGKFFGFGFALETMAVAISPFLFGFIADQVSLVASFRSVSIPWLVGGLFFVVIFLFQRQSKKRVQNLDAGD